jgi:hypothetical protein
MRSPAAPSTSSWCSWRASSSAKPLSSDRGSISLSNFRLLGHEIAIGHAHFLLDTPAREGANVLPSASAGAV